VAAMRAKKGLCCGAGQDGYNAEGRLTLAPHNLDRKANRVSC